MAKTPTRRMPTSASTIPPPAAFPALLTRCYTLWTRRPERNYGRAATRSHRGTIGAACRWPTAASTSPPSTATCTASESRNNRAMGNCFRLTWGFALFTAAVLQPGYGQAEDPPETAQELETRLSRQRHLLIDWAGLTRYGSENAELRAPKAGENRVVFLGDQITELWSAGGGSFFPGKPYLNRGIKD